MKNRLLLLLVVLTLTLSVPVRTASAQDGSFVPTATTIPCPMALPAGEVEGQTVTCGQISVPEDWANAAGKQITITYAIFHSKSQSPFPDPVIYFDGGPGGSSLENAAFLSSKLSKVRATRDLILFDQRGALYSSSLECPLAVELGKTPEQWAAAVPVTETVATTATATVTATAPVDMPDTEEEVVALFSTRGDVQTMLAFAPVIQDPALKSRCGDYLRANNIDLAQYDSVANARDAIGLLQALSYPAYNIYGISYGTRLATVVMRLYQESPDAAALPPIRSVVIDGVMPTTLNQVGENPFSEQYVALRVFADCEADAACGAAFPNIRQRTIDLLNQLSGAPIETSAGATVTLADVTGMLTGLLAHSKRVVYLPLLIDELERGDDTTFQGLKTGTLPPPATPTTAANPLDLIVGRATELAGTANQLGSALNDLAQQTQSLTAAVTTQQSLPEYFLGEAERLALQRPQFGLHEQFEGIGKTAVDEPTRATIEAFIALYDDAQKRAILTSILNVMSDDDIRVTAAVLATEQARERFTSPVSTYMNRVVICNDSWGGLQDVQGFWDRFAAAEAPQLIDGGWSILMNVILYHQDCQNLQVTPAEMADQVQVASNIRTLVTNGSLDATTPKEWGDLVYNSLTNAISTTIPYGGHGATLQTACGQDMVVAFITYPDAPLDTACTAALQPQWVLPAPEATP